MLKHVLVPDGDDGDLGAVARREKAGQGFEEIDDHVRVVSFHCRLDGGKAVEKGRGSSQFVHQCEPGTHRAVVRVGHKAWTFDEGHRSVESLPKKGGDRPALAGPHDHLSNPVAGLRQPAAQRERLREVPPSLPLNDKEATHRHLTLGPLRRRWRITDP